MSRPDANTPRLVSIRFTIREYIRKKHILGLMLLVICLMPIQAGVAKEQSADGSRKKNYNIESSQKLVSKEEHLVQTKPGFHKFKLVKGTGVEVCEAYLERLNKTWFERLPFCDRPENDTVPGFEKLNRVALTPEEIYTIKYRIIGFMSGDQFRYDRQAVYEGKDTLRPENKEREIGYIRDSVKLDRIGAYRYDPPVNFDNDNVPENLLIWKQSRFRCGSIHDEYEHFPQGGLTVVLVLTPDSRIVDETLTKQMIGHPVGGYPTPDNLGFYEKFRPIGQKMGIFRYKGITYFDTFFDTWGDFEGKRRDNSDIARTLGVFSRGQLDRKGIWETHQICEYLWEIPYDADN